MKQTACENEDKYEKNLIIKKLTSSWVIHNTKYYETSENSAQALLMTSVPLASTKW